jgi:Ca2+-binding RTX toxin-like protein
MPVGGAGSDNFYGTTIDDLATGTTWNPGDNLAAGAGVDTFNLTMSGNNTGTTYNLLASNLEIINVGNFDANDSTDATISAASATGITNVNITGGSGDTNFTGLASVVSIGSANATGDIAVTYAASVLAGTTDTQAVVLNSAGSSSNAVKVTVSDGTNTAETFAITSNGTANVLNLPTANNAKTINVTGAGALNFDADAEDTITKIDASSATGAVTIKNLGASIISIEGGVGNDVVINNSTSAFDVNDTVNGGAGTDTLGLSAAITAANAAKITGFETLTLGDNVSQAVDAFTGITSLVVNHTVVDGSTDADSCTSAFTNTAGTETLMVEAMGANDDVTVSLKTNGTADSIAVIAGSSTAGTTVDVLNLDNFETISITSRGTANTVTDLTATSLKTLNISGSQAITIDDNSSGTWSSLTSVNASAATANVNFAGTSGGLDRAATVIGGSGNDTFIGSSTASGDSIVGGAGNDSLTGAGGNDNISGGDGNDTINVSASSVTAVVTGGEGNDTITGGSGNDNVAGDAGDDTFIYNTWTSINSLDTINGGSGNDVLSTDATAVTLNDSSLSGVSNLEVIGFGSNDTSGSVTVTISDVGMGAFNNAITVRNIGTTDAQTHTVTAANVLSSSSKVTFIGAGDQETYVIGNGIDSASMGSNDDTVSVTNTAYLSATDTLAGGTGTDTLAFSQDVSTMTTISAAQLTNITGFERISFDVAGGTGDTTDDFRVDLTDTFLSANAVSGTGVFIVTRGDLETSPDTGDLRIDATAVGASYNLRLAGAAGADSLFGGAGSDVIVGGTGADSLTGGAGNDTFLLTFNDDSATARDNFGIATNGFNDNGADTITGGAGNDVYVFDQAGITTITITDFALPTSGILASSVIDRFELDGLSLAFNSNFDVVEVETGVMSGNDDIGNDSDIVIMANKTYADLASVATDVAEGRDAVSEDMIIIWADSFNQIHVSYTTDGNDTTKFVDLSILQNVTLAGVVTGVTATTMGTLFDVA